MMTIAIPPSCRMAGLPRVEDAIVLIRQSLAPIAQTKRAPIYDAANLVLAEDARACISMPPHDRSAMDGYAYCHASGPVLRLLGRATAGNAFPHAVKDGECVAVATGACLPEGCDTVAMVEHCRQTAEGIVVQARAGANIRYRGEDFHEGDLIVPQGTRLNARQIALMASAGLTHLKVRRQLRVAILSIGDEIGGKGGIFDANRPMLLSLCREMGCHVTDLGILPDHRATIAHSLARAAAAHDVVIGSAGTSVGDEDHAKDAILDCGGEVLVAGVAVKPGKPVGFGRIGNCLHIALPGNPAAAFATFLMLGLPLLRYLGSEKSRDDQGQIVHANFSYRKKPGMREYLRVCLSRGEHGFVEARRTGKDGSAMLTSLAGSDGFLDLPEDVTEIEPGTPAVYRSFKELLTP